MRTSAQQQWKAASRAYRARRRAAAGIGMYLRARPLGVSAERADREEVDAQATLAALPAAPAPTGWDHPQDQAATFAAKAEARRRVLAIAREVHAELARRAAERVDCALAGVEPPRYIESDEILRERPTGALRGYLAVVRGNPHPLDHLHDVEQNLRISREFAAVWARIGWGAAA